VSALDVFGLLAKMSTIMASAAIRSALTTSVAGTPRTLAWVHRVAIGLAVTRPLIATRTACHNTTKGVVST
jgi:hypothetical protein